MRIFRLRKQTKPRARHEKNNLEPAETQTPDEHLISLNSESWTERRRAAQHLTAGAELTNDHVTTLMFVMEHDEMPSVRVAAAECLAHNGYAAGFAIPALIMLVDDKACWSDAITALKNIKVGNRDVLRVLSRALSDPLKRVQAADTLGSFGPSAREALPALEAICQYCTASTRQQVRTSIGLIRGTLVPSLGEHHKQRIRNEVVAMGEND